MPTLTRPGLEGEILPVTDLPLTLKYLLDLQLPVTSRSRRARCRQPAAAGGVLLQVGRVRRAVRAEEETVAAAGGRGYLELRDRIAKNMGQLTLVTVG